MSPCLRVSASSALRLPPSAFLVIALLLLAVAAVFGQTLDFNFVNFDDDQYVIANAQLMRGLTGETAAWAITTYYASNWHPLTWLSHTLDCQLYGLHPWGHHLTNVLLHAAAAVLLFLALRRMTGALWPSAWVAAVFAIHPLRVESVAWVAERKDVLSGLCFMLTLWLYARYVDRAEGGRRKAEGSGATAGLSSSADSTGGQATRGTRQAEGGRRKAGGRVAILALYLSVVAAFALGLTAKPMLVTLPFVLLLLDYWPLGRFSKDEGGRMKDEGGRGKTERCGLVGRAALDAPCIRQENRLFHPSSLIPHPSSLARPVVEKIPLFVLAAASCVVTLAAQRDAIKPLEQVAFAGRVANAAVAYVVYLGKMLYPAGLAVFYPLPKGPPPVWEVVAAAGALLAISTAVLVVRRRCPYLLFGWLWYLGTLVPVIGLVQVGDQAMADRYTYLTQIGLYMAFAWGAADMAGAGPYRRWPLAAVSALVLAGLIVCAWRQTRHWRDSETLWTHTLACTSQNPIAQNNLGNAFAGHGQLDKAVDHYRKALEIKPDYELAQYNLGNALCGRGQFDEAIDHYRKAVAIKPDYVEARSNLGNALCSRGQLDEAIDHYRQALKIKPDAVEVNYNLGDALAGRGQVNEALGYYQKALDLATARNDRALADVIRARIEIYRAGKPFRDQRQGGKG
ncbi:MAG: tetratricopeptide repeat protein [Thermoguttaceae bacterium]